MTLPNIAMPITTTRPETSSPAGYTFVSERETAVLYPSFGHLDEGDSVWRIHVRGVIYEPGVESLKRRLMLQVLRRLMDATHECFESEIFRERISAFAGGPARGRTVLLSVGGRLHVLPEATQRNGHFSGTLRIPVEEAAALAPDGWLDFQVFTGEPDPRSFSGRALLLPEEGISVISDIDDTIKHSEVHCRRTLLANTFLREFSSIEGMSALYRRWSEQGADFHYVSSSPWQLYLPLANLCDAHGFPAGTFHLRSFRLYNHMLRRMLLIRTPGKGAEIRQLVESFPRRKFLLVGDSAEHDPELYGSVARHFPERVQGIFIREMSTSAWTMARAERAFRELPSGLWRIFRTPRELPFHLAPLGRVAYATSPAGLALA